MGTLSLAAPLVLFEKSRLWAGTGFHLLPSFHHHPTQHNYITQTVTHRVTLTLTSNIIHYTDTRPTRNVVCPSGAWLKNRPHSKPCPPCVEPEARNSAVGWHWNTHTHTHTHTHTYINISFVSYSVKSFAIGAEYPTHFMVFLEKSLTLGRKKTQVGDMTTLWLRL